MQDWLRLGGRPTLVFGAGGLGGASALSLAAAGARVALTDVNTENLDAVVRAAKEAGHDIKPLVADLRTADGCRAAVREALGRRSGLWARRRSSCTRGSGGGGGQADGPRRRGVPQAAAGAGRRPGGRGPQRRRRRARYPPPGGLRSPWTAGRPGSGPTWARASGAIRSSWRPACSTSGTGRPVDRHRREPATTSPATRATPDQVQPPVR